MSKEPMKVTEKFCTKCESNKKAEEFYKDSSKKSGLSTHCIDCTKHRFNSRYVKKGRSKLSPEEKKERKKANQRKHRSKHKEKINAKGRGYNNRPERKVKSKIFRNEHKEENKIYQRFWYLKNKEKASIRMRKNYQENKEERKLSVKMRRLNKRIKVNSEKLVYKVRKRTHTPKMSKQEKKCINELYFYASLMGYHVDHIIPLSLGGLNCLGNLQAVSVGLNLRKSTKVGRFTDNLQGICCVPFFEGLKEDHLNVILTLD